MTTTERAFRDFLRHGGERPAPVLLTLRTFADRDAARLSATVATVERRALGAVR